MDPARAVMAVFNALVLTAVAIWYHDVALDAIVAFVTSLPVILLGALIVPAGLILFAFGLMSARGGGRR